jgi:hypothetical protein
MMLGQRIDRGDGRGGTNELPEIVAPAQNASDRHAFAAKAA